MENAKTLDAARNDAIRYAREVAARYSVADSVSVSVYQKGPTFFVRPNKHSEGFGPIPEGAEVVCIAQRWSENEVQTRYSGASSEWT